jgi:hypothetical protein
MQVAIDPATPTIIVTQRTDADVEYAGTLRFLHREILPHTLVVNLASHAGAARIALDAVASDWRVVAELSSAPGWQERMELKTLEARIAKQQETWGSGAAEIAPAVIGPEDLRRDFDELDVTASLWIAGQRPWNSYQAGCRTFGEFQSEFAGMAGDDWQLDAVRDAREQRTMMTLRWCGFELDTPQIRLRVGFAGPHLLKQHDGGMTFALAGRRFRRRDWANGTVTFHSVDGPVENDPPLVLDSATADDAAALRAALWQRLHDEVRRP